MYMKFLDKDQREVHLTYKTNKDVPTGNHVLAIPVYQHQLLFTRHKIRGIEFPGGKRERNETSIDAIRRELYEETGAHAIDIKYIAQYKVETNSNIDFVKDVYFIQVDTLKQQSDYLETDGPCLFQSVESIPDNKKSFLLKDDAILHCYERVKALGFY